MSEATVKALADAIYDAYQDSGLLDELDNEQVYEVAYVASRTIEAAGTTKAIVRVWLEENGFTIPKFAELSYRLWDGPEYHRCERGLTDEDRSQRVRMWAEAIQEVSS